MATLPPVARGVMTYVATFSPAARVAVSVMPAVSAARKPLSLAVNPGSAAPYTFVASAAVTVAGFGVIVKVAVL